MAKQRLKEEASAPKPNPSQIVYHETYLPITTKDGVRVKGRGSRRVLSRVGDDGPRQSSTKSETSADPFGIIEPFSELKVAPPVTQMKMKNQDTESEDLIEL
jgi:hypothetical protein